MFIILSRSYSLTNGNHSYGIPHQAHLYFTPAFIVVSFLCLLLNTPFLNSFLGSPHLYSVISQSLTWPFGVRSFITHLFNRIPSHTICLSLCSYSAQSQKSSWLIPPSWDYFPVRRSLALLSRRARLVSGVRCAPPLRHDFALFSRSSQGPAGRGRCCCPEAWARHVRGCTYTPL